MARVTHVKRAQQRYHTKPVIDPATGEQKVTPVLRRDGSPKATKGGRPVILRVTERDLTRPKPLFKCGWCKEEIALGTPYKWIEPHGSAVLTRHEACPTWHVWEYSNSLSARIAQIQSESAPETVESEDEANDWLAGKASEIRELAEEKRESASNIEDGFGHATYQSDELNQTADDLESWADDVESTDLPEYPEAEEQDCESGNHGDQDDVCEVCGGTMKFTPDEPTEDQIDEWQAEVASAMNDALANSPV